MADISVEQIVAFFNTLQPDQITKLLDGIKDRSLNAATALTTLTGKFGDIKNIAKQTGEAAKLALEKIENFNIGNLVQLVPQLAATHKELFNIGGQVLLLRETIAGGFSTEAFDILGRSAHTASGSITEAVESVAKIGQTLPLGDNVKGIINFITPLTKLADSSKNFESGLIAVTAASGELGDLLKNVGEDLSGLNLKAEKFSQLTYQIGNASGLSTKQIAEYAKTLMGIPGAMDMSISSINRGIDDMHLLDATIKIANGTGQEFSDVFREMNLVYREFGTTGKDALEYVSRLSVASQALKMPLDLVRDYTESAASSFKFLGDNSQAAINVLERFGPALKTSGMGPKAIKDLVGDVTHAISQMGLAQKAFLSGQSGGPGGLQGAYQIDMLMRQGKMDEVQRKVEESLRHQFGGRIVTLEEAAKDSRAAGQFTKQVQLLTQGPTKIANSDAEAYRILDVLAKGSGSKAGSIIKPPEEAFKSALKTGDALQERQTNILTKIQNDSERSAQLASISAYNLSRLVAGTAHQNLNEVINQARDRGTKLAADSGKLITGQGIDQGKEVKEVVKDFFSNLPKEHHNANQAVAAFTDHLINLGKHTKDNLTKSTLNHRWLPETSSRPTIPMQLVANNVPKIEQSNTNFNPKLGSSSNNRDSEKLDIIIHALCEKCMGVIAEEKATKIGKKLLQQRESNKAIAVQLGHDNGL